MKPITNVLDAHNSQLTGLEYEECFSDIHPCFNYFFSAFLARNTPE